jgi:hypothetical protein
MPGRIFQLLRHSLTTLSSVTRDIVHLAVLTSRSRRALAAENLFFFRKLGFRWRGGCCGGAQVAAIHPDT